MMEHDFFPKYVVPAALSASKTTSNVLPSSMFLRSNTTRWFAMLAVEGSN